MNTPVCDGVTLSEQLSACKFALFDTAIGVCAIVGTVRGVEVVQLPLPDKDKTRMRIRQRHGSLAEVVPPDAGQTAIDGMHALLEGEPANLSDVVLDLAGECEFDRLVYGIGRSIPAGGTMTSPRPRRR